MEQQSILAVKEITGFVDDLKEATRKRIKISAKFDKICICGMGASAIGGDIIKDMIFNQSPVQVFVVKFIDIPHWVNENTLVIVCSYSGNTKETLSMYDQAMEKKCKIVAITAGGKLMEKCQNDKNTLIKVRAGLQPRNALGLILGYMANVMEAVGAANCNTEIKRLIPEMRKLRNDIGVKNPESYAKKVAVKIQGASPIIYSTLGIEASAVRWRQQINENSKMMAFCGSIYELNQNWIIDWPESTDRFNCVPVILCEEDASDITKNMVKTFTSALKASGVEPIVVTIRGKTAVERSLRAVIIGDHISLYLALMNKVDPIQVKYIISFKEKVAERLNRKKNV